LGSSTFDGYEHCDCHRNYKEGHTDSKETYENRYYYNPEFGIRITYLMQYGVSMPMYGHLPPNMSSQTVRKNMTMKQQFAKYMDISETSIDYSEASIGELSALPKVLRQFATKWENDVDIVLWNVGIWDAGVDGKEKVTNLIMESISEFLKSNGKNGLAFWKGSTALHVDHWDSKRDRWPFEKDQEAHAAAKKNGWAVIDYVQAMQQLQKHLSWERPNISPFYHDFFWDGCHLQPWVYEELNQIMMTRVFHELEKKNNDEK
jgi:hypothetical protein